MCGFFHGESGLASRSSMFNLAVSCNVAQSSVSRDEVNPAVTMFAHLTAQSPQDAAVELKLDNFENAWDPTEGSAMSSYPRQGCRWRPLSHAHIQEVYQNLPVELATTTLSLCSGCYSQSYLF